MNTDTEILEWINKQTNLKIFIGTKLTGPLVRIYDNHRLIAKGETIQKAVETLIKSS